MLTYELQKTPGVPLYEALYRCIRGDILSGVLSAGEKLPSKRTLAENLKVSKITVETAYNQLLSEGYIRSAEKVGYFVESVLPAAPKQAQTAPAPQAKEQCLDLTANGSAHFPFSVWSKLQRQVLLDYGEALLKPLPNQGAWELRSAIAAHLSGFRGMHVHPDNIIIGSGTDFLYNLLIQLLGREKIYAVEEPGYSKIRKIYESAGVRCVSAEMDHQGVLPDELGDARVLHFSPAHHFPTGIITPMGRRQELLRWAIEQDGYIIEDDYDSEFRFHAHPLPSVYAVDRNSRCIYMNTFSKSLAPSIRVGFMVVPGPLMDKFREKLGFYSCTVSSFEQYTLARFLSEGHFEKHINRMRKFYKSRRDKVLSSLERCPWADQMTIREEDAGLHFLVTVRTHMSGDEITDTWAKAGIRVRTLDSYYHGAVPEEAERCLLVNYSGLDEGELFRLEHLPV